MAKSKAPLDSQSGFTLAELVVVVAVVLVVAALSVPNLTRAIDTARIKGAAQSLAAAYQDARIRATQNDTSYQVLIFRPEFRLPRFALIWMGMGLAAPAIRSPLLQRRSK